MHEKEQMSGEQTEDTALHERVLLSQLILGTAITLDG